MYCKIVNSKKIQNVVAAIIKKDKHNFEVILLTTNNNYRELAKQAKELNVKNLIINNKKQYLNLKNKFKNKKVNIYNNFLNLSKIFNKKIDYTMCAISGLEGLSSTLDVIKFTKNVAIATIHNGIVGGKHNGIKKPVTKNPSLISWLRTTEKIASQIPPTA